MFLDRAATACYFLSAILLLAGAYGYFTQEDGPDATIAEPERMLTHLTAGEPNTAKHEPPFVVAAGASEPIECSLEVGRAGDFEGQIHVYYDDGGLRETVLVIRGQAGEATGAAAGAPSASH
jgi:hypothetical protein